MARIRKFSIARKILNRFWYSKHALYALLLPLSHLIFIGVEIRRQILVKFFQKKSKLPVIVVGNITLGGSGKTPVVIELANALSKRNIKVGVVSRGYKAHAPYYPFEVSLKSDAYIVGDEALLIKHKTSLPVVISPNRQKAINYLLEHYGCQIVISDDGLQHYRMPRAMEVVIMDSRKCNGLAFPFGPLREPLKRINDADLVLVNGHLQGAYSFKVVAGNFINLKTLEEKKAEFFAGDVHAVAGIGNAQNFFDLLGQLNIKITPNPYPDHHQFSYEDLATFSGNIIMTEKDAIKCTSFCGDNMFSLPIKLEIEENFWRAFYSHHIFNGILR